MGVEDLFDTAVFNAQNMGAKLADTVLSTPDSAAPAFSLEALWSLAVLYAAGLGTSISPCSLGLLPITVSYISSAANERRDKQTILPTLAFAVGLAVVFTALG